MQLKTWRMVAVLISMLAATAVSAEMRCGNRLVSEGDYKAEVLAKCGTPDWRDSWTEHLIDDYGSALERRFSFQRDLWLYDLGPRTFIRLLTFENGRLVAVETGGRGYVGREPRSGACDIDHLPDGLTTYEVQRRCGRPFFVDARPVETFVALDGRRRRLIETRVEEWSYNLGPRQFLRILIFENGRLVDTVTGDRGF